MALKKDFWGDFSTGYSNKAFCVVSFLKGPKAIYSVELILGYQYIVQGQKKSMTTQKALIRRGVWIC
jgi:hypothetical protein